MLRLPAPNTPYKFHIDTALICPLVCFTVVLEITQNCPCVVLGTRTPRFEPWPRYWRFLAETYPAADLTWRARRRIAE
jgi:hypothetical protein